MTDDAFIAVSTYDEAETARRAAAELVANGIGATIAEHAADGDDDAAVHELTVLRVDAVRASEILGVDPPELGEEDEPSKPPWKTVLIVWAIAMVVFPLLAFWLAYSAGS